MDNEQKDVFSYEPTVILTSRKTNDESIVPDKTNLRIPKVEIDRIALSSMIWGIISVVFFVIFPFAIVSIVKGAKSVMAPHNKKFAKTGIILGIVSLVLFVGATVLFVLFFDKIVPVELIDSVKTFIFSLLGK